MSFIIAAEHFTLTPAIRHQATQEIQRLVQQLDAGARVRVFLKRAPGLGFSALLRIRWHGRDWIFSEAASELYPALSAAREKAARAIARDKRQAQHVRRTPAA